MLSGMRHKTLVALACVMIAMVMACSAAESESEPTPVITTVPTQAVARIDSDPIVTVTPEPIATPTGITFTPTPEPTTTPTEIPSTPTSVPAPTTTPVSVAVAKSTEVPTTSTPTPTSLPTATAEPTPTVTPMPTQTSTAIPTLTPTDTPTTVPAITRDELDGVYPCTEQGSAIFTSSVFPIDLITYIEPMGKMASSHVTPTDHLYVHRDPWAGEDNDYVVAPAGGWIVEISNNEERTARWDTSIMVPDHRILFMHSCTFFTIFIHLGELAPAVIEQIGDIPPNSQWFSTRSAPIQVNAGEPIAKMGLTGFDWSVHDTNTTLTGFVIPDHYEGENWKIHTVDPFQFYSEPLKSDLLSKSIREVEPRAGKIDHDIENTISGNWFLDGTSGYKPIYSGGGEYWISHLTIAYDWIDPSQIRISIGIDTGINDEQDCNVCFGNYAVRGNEPDPAIIGSEAGMVKYELMSRKGPNHVEIGDNSLGTFLVQHLGDRSIRVEVISDTSPDKVAEFSDASLIYRR